jgi:Tfp pilus assembly protein PilV
MISKIKKGIKGFTLVEALVAISILMVAVASPMVIAQKGLTSAFYSKDQMTATFLGQDALEYVKNVRDVVGLSQVANTASTTWLGSLYTNCNHPNDCEIDTITGVYRTLSQNIPLLICRDSLTKKFLYYGYVCNNGSTGTPSKFSRTISITEPALPLFNNWDEALVTVDVSWTSTNGLEEVKLSDFIYNYWENL